MRRIFNILVLISVLAFPFIVGCNNEPKEIEPRIDYNEFIKQNVGFDKYDSVYTLMTKADYGYACVYLEYDDFKNEEQLEELKTKRFNEAKLIIDNLIKFNE